MNKTFLNMDEYEATGLCYKDNGNPMLVRKDNPGCMIFGRYKSKNQPLYMCVEIPRSYPTSSNIYYFSEAPDRTLTFINKENISCGTVRTLRLSPKEVKRIADEEEEYINDIKNGDCTLLGKSLYEDGCPRDLYICSYSNGRLRLLKDYEIDDVTDIYYV